MLYAVVTAMAIIASCYLLFRRGNAFAPDITTPARLRRWTAAFFASLALNHMWYMPIFFHISSEDTMMIDLIGGLLDSMILFPLAIAVLLAMLQDSRRPLWPVAVMAAPLVALLMCLGLIIYMIRALRRYGRWLRDNYADLEHKEVWQSFVVLAIIILVFGVYAFTSEGQVYQYSMQVIIAMFICYLLWRVETLSDLSIPHAQPFPAEEKTTAPESIESHALSSATHENISQLLQQYCVDTQLYLQHDLSISQLAKAVGTNRFYLSQYFSGKGITYNAYINDLRISHFMSLYREAIATQRSFTAQQLAHESGYRSYSTFGIAFKQRTGQTVTAWMRDTAK